jgi:4-amino-4-deoxy-L-arabinose transferase-like glycosyltransferase
MSRTRRFLSKAIDPLIALSLGAAYVWLLLSTVKNLGYARDEGFYFQAAKSYGAWFDLLTTHPKQALEQITVDRYWSANHEHPALMKSLFALSHKYLYRHWHWFSEEGTSMRFAGMVVSSLAVSTTYLWGQKAIGRLAGLVAAVLLAMMPRVFYHSHLDCFDMPVASMWLVTVYAYWRSLERGGWAWPIATGILYGLLLDTKHNSWLLPFALIAHLVITRGGKLWRDLRAGRIPVPSALFAMATIGPAVFYLGWPWIWHDTGKRLAAYVAFHMGHVYYNMEFLGRTYWKPPMPLGYPWVMTLATVPGTTLLLFGVGLVASLLYAYGGKLGALGRSIGLEPHTRDPRRYSNDVLWALSIFMSYAPWLSHHTPIFGGTKHWITAYPFMCLFAARGFSLTLDRLRELGRQRFGPGFVRSRATEVVLGASVLAAPIAITLHSQPWGLSAYTPLVGGAPGAATLGLNRTFWGYTTGAEAGYLNEHVPRNGALFLHDTAMQSWDMLRADGRVRSDIRPTLDIEASSTALYHHEPHMERVEYQVWVDYGTDVPAHMGVYDGVPVIWIFARPLPAGGGG